MVGPITTTHSYTTRQLCLNQLTNEDTDRTVLIYIKMMRLITTIPSLQTKPTCISPQIKPSIHVIQVNVNNKDKNMTVLIYIKMVAQTTTTYSYSTKHTHVTNKDAAKIVLMYTDGGPDHNTTFLSNQRSI